MAKKLRKMLAICMVLCMIVGVLPLQALAAGETTSETTTETSPEGLTTNVTTITTSTTDESGNTTVNVTIEKTTSGTTEDGVTVNREESASTTTTSNANGHKTGEHWVEEGKETTTEYGTSVDLTVDVPMQEGESETVAATIPEDSVTGDLKDGEDDAEYDQTTTTVTPGQVTVTTTEVIKSEIIETEKTDMEYVKSETTPDGTNDLTYMDEAPEAFLPGYTGETMIPEGVDGYDYVLVGSGNTSMFVPAIVFSMPLTDEQKVAQYGENAYINKNSYASYYVSCLTEEDRNNIAKTEDGAYVTDDEGFILDKDGNRVLKEELVTKSPNGDTLYLHRFDNTSANHKVEGWYEDGKWVEELNGSNKYTAVWAGPQQFVLVDKEGNIITTYCADNATPTQDAFGYNVQNLEDATYYSEEEAKQIRSIALNGYWGTIGTETDVNGQQVPKVGSLEAMKQNLLATGQFTEAELESLTDGVALTATQMAIWSCSNKMSGIEFINSHYSNWGMGNVPADKEDEVKLMFRVYDYLMALTPAETENTTADTIINFDNFVDNMSVTVVEKANGHSNNLDTDHTNDAYVTNLTFALVVKPSNENGDDLVVSVVDAHGNEIASARIAGEAKDGEKVLVPDADGNYCFEGITMVEGEQNFQLNLQGIQHLKEGVYLYTSEVVDGTSSQTMVGLASGDRGVNVSMEIKFELNVEDEVVATERVWRDEGDPTDIPEEEPPVDPDEEPEEEPEPPHTSRLGIDDNTVEIPDEEVPLADVPTTGDESGLWIVAIMMAAAALYVVNIISKKRQHEAF